MKKKWCAFAGIFVILLSFCGCTDQIWSQDWEEYTDDMGKWSSQLAGVFDGPPIVACIDHIIAYPADGYMHNKTYYCDEKYLNKIQQFYFTEYVGGKLATPSERMMDVRYLKQMYSMMKKKEKNWVTVKLVSNVDYSRICNFNSILV